MRTLKPPRLLSSIGKGVRTAVTTVAVLIVTSVVSVLIIAVAAVDQRSEWIDWLARSWARIILATAGIRVTVDGRAHIDPYGQYIVVSNHQSAFDIMCHFVALPISIRALAKTELFSIPLFGQLLRSMGMVPIDRRAAFHQHDAINHAAEAALDRGHSLLVYPEGTTSRTGQIAPFKKGAFVIATRSQLPILPVTISGSYQTHLPDTRIVNGGAVHITISEPIAPVGSASELRDRTEEVIRTILGDVSTRPFTTSCTRHQTAAKRLAPASQEPSEDLRPNPNVTTLTSELRLPRLVPATSDVAAGPTGSNDVESHSGAESGGHLEGPVGDGHAPSQVLVAAHPLPNDVGYVRAADSDTGGRRIDGSAALDRSKAIQPPRRSNHDPI